MPSPEEIGRRMEAARTLRGLTQPRLGTLFKADGLGVRDPERIERGDIPFRRKHLDAACRHLHVPERWFTADDVDEIVGYAPPLPVTPEAVEDLARLLAPQLLAAARDLREEQGPGTPGTA